MALDDLRNTVGICGMLRHRAFFDELAKTKETDATWRSTSAGLAVLRLGGSLSRRQLSCLAWKAIPRRFAPRDDSYDRAFLSVAIDCSRAIRWCVCVASLSKLS